VQGVGYRWFARETAERLGVVGWVRNLPDGSVEGEAEGGETAVNEFMQLLKKSHPYARVERIEEKRVKIRGEENFEIR
jgi:acylphosphatase